MTHYGTEFKNKSHYKVPIFSPHDVRKLRHTIETGSPHLIDANAKYVDITLRLKK